MDKTENDAHGSSEQLSSVKPYISSAYWNAYIDMRKSQINADNFQVYLKAKEVYPFYSA